MKHFVLFQFLALVLLTLSVNCKAQQVVANQGGHYSDNNYELSWTIGEAITSTLIDDDHVLTQGFHQPKLLVSSISSHFKNEHFFKAYPNPVTTQLTLKKIDLNEECTVNITNEIGTTISLETIEESFNSHSIEFSNYSQGVYYLQIISKAGKHLQTLKVVKL